MESHPTNSIVLTTFMLPGNLKRYCHARNIPIIILNSSYSKSIISKLKLLKNLFRDSFYLINKIKTLRLYNNILCVHYIAIPILILRKVGFIKKGTRIYWADFFIHNKRFFYFFSKFLNLLLNNNDKLIVYSEFEIELYSDVLNLNFKQFHYLPLSYIPPSIKSSSEFSKRINFDHLPKHYFFSGGYSHRDYKNLISVFKGLPSINLIVCSSKLNYELENIVLPKNISVLNDVHRLDFLELTKRSYACILLIKSNSGAAGQLFAIESMYHKKTLIASNTRVLSEIVENNVNGLLVDSTLEEIANSIKLLNENEHLTTVYGDRAMERIVKCYGSAAFNASLDLLFDLKLN